MKLYIAGKVSKVSSFGTQHWRDNFCIDLSKRTGLELHQLDPLNIGEELYDPWEIFSNCCKMINACDLFIVFLSDDISVGGSQEILIAKYFGKPVLGYAPYGGKFNGATREMQGKQITDFKDPFVFSTCDIVCGTLDEVAEAVKNYKDIQTVLIEKLLNMALGA